MKGGLILYRFMIIYQKSSGEIIYRTCKSRPTYQVGDKTSMGWKVLDIKNMYKGNTYKSYDYRQVISRKISLSKIISKLQSSQIKELANVISNFMLIYIFVKIFVNYNIL